MQSVNDKQKVRDLARLVGLFSERHYAFLIPFNFGVQPSKSLKYSFANS
jgi:hypothetical protein